MASVQKRTRHGRTRWVARWRDGAGRDHSRTFDSRAAAAAFVHRAEADARSVRPEIATARATLTVGSWLDTWLDDVVAIRVTAGRLRPRTAAGYESTVRLHLAPAIGHLLLVDLRVADVDLLLDRLLAAGSAPATARHTRAVLSAALTAAGRADLVDRNVAQLAEPPTITTPPPSTFNDDELDRILAAAEEHRLGTAILFTVLTGRRLSAVVALDWDDVDLRAATYRVVRTTHRIPTSAARVATPGIVDGPPKTQASGRLLPLPDAAVTLLRAHRRAQATERLAAVEWVGCDRIWTSTSGTPLEPRQLSLAFTRIRDAAGVSARSVSGRARGMHELRRTWTEHKRRAGVPLEDVVRLGGWATPTIMLRHYAASPDDRLRDAANR
jgi:integrase